MWIIKNIQFINDGISGIFCLVTKPYDALTFRLNVNLSRKHYLCLHD